MSSLLKYTKWLIPLCFLTVYLVWGTTYIFVAYAVEEIPPFLLSGIRYFLASLILFGLAFSMKQFEGITKNQIKNSLFAGILFIGIGASGIALVLKYLDTGFTSLLIATQPLVTVLMMWLLNKERPTNLAFLGVFLGLIGSYLLVSQQNIVATADQWFAVLFIAFCIVIWAYATIFVNKGDLPKSFITNTGFQLLSGGLFALLISVIIGEGSADWMNLKPITWISMFVLIVLGGAIVFIAFNYLLKKSTPDKVSTTTYVNPIIAISLGWWFRDELVTTQSIIAACVMLTGVLFINFDEETLKRVFLSPFQKKKTEEIEKRNI